MSEKEEWRPIEGYDRKYYISSFGRVKSLKRQPRILKTFVNNKGYRRVCLSKDGHARYYLVSRLVAQAFCENDNPKEKTTVDHIDTNKLNDHADNLRWLSPKENTQIYYREQRKEKKNEPTDD